MWQARGRRFAFSDALFPLLILSYAQYENLLWSIQLWYCLGMFFVLVALGCIILYRPGAPAWIPLCAALAVDALALCGALGPIVMPPLLCWLAWIFLRRWRTRRDRPLAPTLALGALILVGVASCAALWLLFQHTPNPAPFTLEYAGATFLQFLSMAFAPGLDNWPLWGALSALTAVLTAVVLLAALRRPERRDRALGLLLLLLAIIGLAAGIALNRSYLGGQAPRYFIFASPIVALAAITAALHLPRAVAAVAPLALLATIICLYGHDRLQAENMGNYRRQGDRALQADLARGLPLDVVAARNGNAVWIFDSATVPSLLEEMYTYRLGPFKKIAYAPAAPIAYERVDLPVQPVFLHSLAAQPGHVFTSTALDPHMILQLPAPRQVAGIELTFVIQTGGVIPWSQLQVSWGLGRAGLDLPGHFTQIRQATGPQTQTQIYWVFDALDTIRIDPGEHPGEFTLQKITLLVPPG